MAALALAMTSVPTEPSAAADDALGNSATGVTTAKDNAGKIEASLLAGRVVKEAASRIVDDIGTDFSSLTFVVLPVAKTENPDDVIGFDGWDVLGAVKDLPVVADMVTVRDELQRFRHRHAVLSARAADRCKPAYQGEKSISSVITGINSTLTAAAPLFDLLKQDFTYSNIKIGMRDGMLVTAIRAELIERAKPSSAGQSAGASSMLEAVEDTERLLASLPKPALCPDFVTENNAELAKLKNAFASFRRSLDGPASISGKTLLAAAGEQFRRYGAKPATLVLAIDAVGASMVEKKNLFTMFGAEAVTVSTGIVVSYEHYEPYSGGLRSLKNAGVLSCMSGAMGIRALHKAKDQHTRAICF